MISEDNIKKRISVLDTDIQKVSSQSTNTGFAPNSQIAPTVATKVLAAVIISSPGLIPNE